MIGSAGSAGSAARTATRLLSVAGFLLLVAWLIANDPTTAPRGAAAEGGRREPAASWRTDRVWDDGQAEFAAYEVRWARYGRHYPGTALLVLVKEPWNPELDVKADTVRPEGFEVLKLNHLRDVPTGIYTYHQMASVFVRRADGALVKLAATSSEACGISNADLRRGRLATRSYFDGQGDRAMAWPRGALPEDGLPLMLRDWVAGATPAELAVFPSLMAGRYGELEPVRYAVRRGRRAVTVPAGQFATVELRLEAGDRWLAYRFESASPHRLVEFERDDGTSYRLLKAERLAYWTRHDPGDESWLPPALR